MTLEELKYVGLQDYSFLVFNYFFITINKNYKILVSKKMNGQMADEYFFVNFWYGLIRGTSVTGDYTD